MFNPPAQPDAPETDSNNDSASVTEERSGNVHADFPANNAAVEAEIQRFNAWHEAWKARMAEKEVILQDRKQKRAALEKRIKEVAAEKLKMETTLKSELIRQKHAEAKLEKRIRKAESMVANQQVLADIVQQYEAGKETVTKLDNIRLKKLKGFGNVVQSRKSVLVEAETALKNEVERKENVIKERAEERARLYIEIEEKEKYLAARTATIAELEWEKNTLEEEIRSLGSLKEEFATRLEAARQKKSELNKRVETDEKSSEELKQKLADATKEARNVLDAVKAQEAKVSQLKVELAAKKKVVEIQAEGLKQRSDQMERITNELKTRRAELEALRNEPLQAPPVVAEEASSQVKEEVPDSQIDPSRMPRSASASSFASDYMDINMMSFTATPIPDTPEPNGAVITPSQYRRNFRASTPVSFQPRDKEN